MATKRTDGQRPRMIHCEHCGEDYASSYKRCPFCDEADDESGYYDDEETIRLRGGKRLVGSPRPNNSRGGGYGGSPSPLNIFFTVVSLALIVAAVIIVISIIKPLVDRGKTTLPEGPTPPASTQPARLPSPTPANTPTAAPDASGTPDSTAPPIPANSTPPSAPPSAPPTPNVPASQTATGFTLNKSEFTLSDQWPAPITLKVTFTPAGTTGTITWTSSNPDIASVDSNGTVSHGSKTGTVTITATMAGGVSQTCRVHNTVTNGGSGTAAPSGNTGSSAGSSGSGSAALSLSRSDFTLVPGESYRIKVSGNSGTPSWSIGNTSVATVSSDGTVTYAGPGSTTLTCTVDGQTLTCIVRGKSS